MTSAYSARVTKKIYSQGDNQCQGTPTTEPTYYVGEIRNEEACTNMDTDNNGVNDASLRNRYCDRSYQIYHEEMFSSVNCVCLTSPAICIKEWPLGICTLHGQIPMIIECDEWTTILPNTVTTVLNITTHVHDYASYHTNITEVTEHHHHKNVTEQHVHNTIQQNVTNITRIVNETVEVIMERAVNTTVTKEIWGVSEAAFYWATGLTFAGVVVIAYFVYHTITTNKREELKAATQLTSYKGDGKYTPRMNRIF